MDKNPQVKEGSLKFLNRCLSTAPVAIPPAQIKSLTDPLSGLLEDGHAGARDEAASVLGTLMKMVGERPLNALMDSLADVRKAKVKEAYEKATVKCKSAAPKAAPPPAKAPATKKPGAKKEAAPPIELEEEAPKKPAGKPPARLGVCAVIAFEPCNSDCFIRPKNRPRPVPLQVLARSLLPLRSKSSLQLQPPPSHLKVVLRHHRVV